MLKGNWAEIFRQKLKAVNRECAIVFLYNRVKKKNSKKCSAPYFRGKGKCISKDCTQTYEFIINKRTKPITVDVFESGEKNHTSGRIFRLPIRRNKRKKLYKEILIKGATNVAAEKKLKLNSEEFKAGNYSEAPLKKTLNTINYEYNNQFRLHEHPIIELELARQLWVEADDESSFLKGYVHQLSMFPFYASLYTEKQLEIYIERAKQKRLILHLDATGGIIQNKGLHPQNKRVFYYALVVAGCPDEGISSMPLSEHMTNNHTAPNLTFWLLDFLLQMYNFKGTKYLPSVIVTDFSWALLNASCLAFNGEKLINFINNCFVAMTSNEKFLDNKTLLHICAAHLLKFVFNKLKQFDALNETKQLAKFAFARLVVCESLDEARSIFASMCNVFGTKYHSQLVNNNLNYLHENIQQCNSIRYDVNNIDDSAAADISNVILEEQLEKRSLVPKTSTTIRDTSLFYTYFKEGNEHFLKDVEDDGVDESRKLNKFFIRPFISYLLTSIMYIFPLWGGVLIKKKTGLSRITNSNVENWFRRLKYNILQKKRGPPAFVARKLFPYLKVTLRDYLSTINKSAILKEGKL